jgi:hypothetical protein
VTREEFIKLVIRYGDECTSGGQGYTLTDEYVLLNAIRDAVNVHWTTGKEKEDGN